jgi:hypothetical protein
VIKTRQRTLSGEVPREDGVPVPKANGVLRV